MGLPYASLSVEQRYFIDTVFTKQNVLVDACIGSGKTTAIQTLCDTLPNYLTILYLTYNRLLKVDARQKINNSNVLVTNYHGFVYPHLQRANIRCGVSDSIAKFNKAKLPLPKYDIMIIDEYQDIELDFAEMLEYIKYTNPDMQIVFVGDMAQKIYDKTTLKVEDWARKFMGQRIELEFTQCFRLSKDHAEMLGRVWNKTINGVNPDCKISTMPFHKVNKFLASQEPGNILCLGAKTGQMSKTLNWLETKHNEKFNKNTVYATIQERDANINPSQYTAIFTTFDSSKGMEKPICVVFDWDEKYWHTRNSQPSANNQILRNIFCVAASRGKSQIIFVQNMEPVLTEETLAWKFESKPIEKAVISEMFDFKFTEEVDKCMTFLDIKPVEHNNPKIPIDIADSDGLIDLSPCIGIYQSATYFKNFNIDAALRFAFSKNDFDYKDLSDLPLDSQILYLVSLETHQNRYRHQVITPFVSKEAEYALHSRLSEHLNANSHVEVDCSGTLDGIKLSGRCDVVQDNLIWELKFVQELKREHFLQLAMYLIIMKCKTGRLWNTRDNTIFEVSIKNDKEREFLHQVVKTIRKNADKAEPVQKYSIAQMNAINRYKKNKYQNS